MTVLFNRVMTRMDHIVARQNVLDRKLSLTMSHCNTMLHQILVRDNGIFK